MNMLGFVLMVLGPMCGYYTYRMVPEQGMTTPCLSVIIVLLILALSWTLYNDKNNDKNNDEDNNKNIEKRLKRAKTKVKNLTKQLHSLEAEKENLTSPFKDHEQRILADPSLSHRDKRYKLAVMWHKDTLELMVRCELPDLAQNTCTVCLDEIPSTKLNPCITHKRTSTQKQCGLRLHYACFTQLVLHEMSSAFVFRCPICRESVSSIEDVYGLKVFGPRSYRKASTD